jgi:hypothetical protein
MVGNEEVDHWAAYGLELLIDARDVLRKDYIRVPHETRDVQTHLHKTLVERSGAAPEYSEEMLSMQERIVESATDPLPEAIA